MLAISPRPATVSILWPRRCLAPKHNGADGANKRRAIWQSKSSSAKATVHQQNRTDHTNGVGGRAANGASSPVQLRAGCLLPHMGGAAAVSALFEGFPVNEAHQRDCERQPKHGTTAPRRLLLEHELVCGERVPEWRSQPCCEQQVPGRR